MSNIQFTLTRRHPRALREVINKFNSMCIVLMEETIIIPRWICFRNTVRSVDPGLFPATSTRIESQSTAKTLLFDHFKMFFKINSLSPVLVMFKFICGKYFKDINLTLHRIFKSTLASKCFYKLLCLFTFTKLIIWASAVLIEWMLYVRGT